MGILYNLQSDLKFASYHAKFDENFANYFKKTEPKIKCAVVLTCTWLGLQKSMY